MLPRHRPITFRQKTARRTRRELTSFSRLHAPRADPRSRPSYGPGALLPVPDAESKKMTETADIHGLFGFIAAGDRFEDGDATETGPGRAVLARIAAKIGRTRRPGARSDIPAGATYLAQFVMLDLDQPSRESGQELVGAPTGGSTLGILYGDGPRHDAACYQVPRSPGDPRLLLRVGRSRPTRELRRPGGRCAICRASPARTSTRARRTAGPRCWCRMRARIRTSSSARSTCSGRCSTTPPRRGSPSGWSRRRPSRRRSASPAASIAT